MSVNQQVYLEMLQNVVWPRVKSKSTRLQYWYQQDGATAHTTVQVREWLMSKFGNRVISRFTDRSWPSRSPDLSPLSIRLPVLGCLPGRAQEEPSLILGAVEDDSGGLCGEP